MNYLPKLPEDFLNRCCWRHSSSLDKPVCLAVIFVFMAFCAFGFLECLIHICSYISEKLTKFGHLKMPTKPKKHLPAGEKHKQVTDRTSWNPLIEVFYCEDESSDQETVVFLPEKNLLLFLFSPHRSSAESTPRTQACLFIFAQDRMDQIGQWTNWQASTVHQKTLLRTNIYITCFRVLR